MITDSPVKDYQNIDLSRAIDLVCKNDGVRAYRLLENGDKEVISMYVGTRQLRTSIIDSKYGRETVTPMQPYIDGWTLERNPHMSEFGKGDVVMGVHNQKLYTVLRRKFPSGVYIVLSSRAYLEYTEEQLKNLSYTEILFANRKDLMLVQDNTKVEAKLEDLRVNRPVEKKNLETIKPEEQKNVETKKSKKERKSNEKT